MTRTNVVAELAAAEGALRRIGEQLVPARTASGADGVASSSVTAPALTFASRCSASAVPGISNTFGTEQLLDLIVDALRPALEPKGR